MGSFISFLASLGVIFSKIIEGMFYSRAKHAGKTEAALDAATRELQEVRNAAKNSEINRGRSNTDLDDKLFGVRSESEPTSDSNK